MTSRRLIAAFVIVASLIAVAATIGDLERYGPKVLPPSGPVPPEWTEPCRQTRPAAGKGFVRRCVRVEGIVLWRELDDPDGDGDRHLIVLAAGHIVNLKYPRAFRNDELPDPGSRVKAVGSVSESGDIIMATRVRG